MSRSTTAGTGEVVGGDRGVRPEPEATADRERGTIGNGARYWHVCLKLTSRNAMPPRGPSSPAVES
jgi:hypothetical protein